MLLLCYLTKIVELLIVGDTYLLSHGVAHLVECTGELTLQLDVASQACNRPWVVLYLCDFAHGTLDFHRHESKVVLVVIHKLKERSVGGELVVGELHHLLAAVYQRMGFLTVACYCREELQRVTFGEPLLEQVNGFADGRDKEVEGNLMFDVLIALNHSGKAALALHVTTHAEELGAVGGGWGGRETEDVFPCSDELLDDLRRDDLGLAKREFIVLADDAVGHYAGLHIGIVGVGVVAVVATHQFVDDVEGADVVPTIGSLGELGKHIGHIHLHKLLVEINLHLVLGISEDGVHALIFSRLDVAKNGFLQLLRGMRNAGAVHQIGLGEDTRQVFGDG